MDATKPCEACRMSIDARATRCPHCRTRQPGAAPLHRGGSRLVAGVCGALAGHLGVDPLLVRVAAGVLAAVSGGIVLWVYGLLWVVTPPSENGRAPLGRLVDWLNEALASRQGTPVAQTVGPMNPVQ
ncbi:MAG: PspC domain-containing protein [Myxococcaceae bacterium]